MAEIVVLPQQGNSVEEVVLLDWNVAEGDSVTEGSVLCEVETDKATMEVESTAAGTVLKLLAAAGDEVPVKSPLVVVGDAGEDISGLDLGHGDEQSTPQSSPPQSGPAQTPSEPAPSADTSAPRSAVESGQSPESGATASSVGVSPRAKMRAAERGINPASVTGSGPGGRIIERDVLSASPETTASARGATVGTPGTGVGGRVTVADLAAAETPGASSPAPVSSVGATTILEEVPV
ncbi:MAG TPA: biotin/lipoyl-containing protein, partial [Alkalispirochaeta sp.]|nr:biotin/lipoyl-containing protein [Alkalispirochaeta sp.]